MHFGASLDLRIDSTLPAFVRYLDGLGLSHIELRGSYLDARPDAPDIGTIRDLRESYDLTYTLHAPYDNCNPGSFAGSLRRATTDRLVEAIDTAAAIGAEAVVVHGGSVPSGYPDPVKEYAREQAVLTVREAARHAADVGVPLCVENQRATTTRQYNTSTPSRLATFLDDIGIGPEGLGVTLDVGHAKATGVDPISFAKRFGDRIRVTHLHDNDGTADDHDPLPTYESVAADIGAPYNVLEMKTKADIARCVEG